MNCYKLFMIVFLTLFAFASNGQKYGVAVSNDSTRIYYRTFGSGKPLLIINGGPEMNSDGLCTFRVSRFLRRP